MAGLALATYRLPCMKHERWDFLRSGSASDLITWCSLGLVAVPLFVFVWWVFLQSPSRLATLTPVTAVEVWHEPLGPVAFSTEGLESMVTSPPDWGAIQWKTEVLPSVKELGFAVDLPPMAPKQRVWFRIRLPEQQGGHGRFGLLGNRVIAHGPWAVWVNRQLIQTNLVDWPTQLNVPLRVTVPLGANEVLLAVPYVEPMGYAVGSMFFGPMDVVDSAWAERNVWHMEASRFMAVAGLLLMLVSFHLAWARPQEPIFWVLGLNALAWSAACLQYVFGVAENGARGAWFDFAVDASTTWTVVLAIMFALDFEGISVPRLRAALALYASTSSILVMPLWQWERSALLGFHYFNVAAFLIGVSTLAWHVFKKPRREGWLMLIVLVALLAMGIYTLETLTNYAKPDKVFMYPIGIILLYLTFNYVMNRRTVVALEEAEVHEKTLQQKLDAQEQILTEQHQRLQQLEVERNLATQRESIMQDLHDKVGGNLTTAILQARSGKMSGEEALLVLQELAEEVRHLAKNETKERRPLSQMLTEMRQRFAKRLQHAGISLEWKVDPGLHRTNVHAEERHLMALLSEAIANIVKHANATRILVRAGVSENGFAQISIEDNGTGFSYDEVVEGRGLPGMRSRAEEQGATLVISTGDSGGTKVSLEIPVVKGLAQS